MHLPGTVGPSESLARYLTQRSHYAPSTNSVKPQAFEPPPDLRLSVFRIDGLTVDEVWQNGRVNVVNAMSPPRTLYGMASIKAAAVRNARLDIDADNTPPRHACIVGWPQDKDKRMLAAQRLAALASLVLVPPPVDAGHGS
ncbi:MAG: hypothetical protein NTU41_07325 [Chloroflexi bacterium]|nr:hypothetical protein [Chloroflexota bacterium]